MKLNLKPPNWKETRMSLLNIRKLPDKIAENWAAKAISTGLAIFLFVFHRMANLETRFFSVPLSVQTNGDLIPASPYTRIIRVSLRGDANTIYPIMEDDIEAYIDLRKYDAGGDCRAPVQIRKRGSALSLQPIEINVDPMEISLYLDRKVNKYIPLSVNLRGNVEAGYTLESHSLFPAQVLVDGPAGILGPISELYTDYVDLEGRNEDFSVVVNILNRDPLIVIRGNGMTEFRGFIRRPVPPQEEEM
jgi:YbbR domain-containing protein